MYKEYNISEDFAPLCSQCYCDINSKEFQQAITYGKELWENLSSDEKNKVTKYNIKSFDNADIEVRVFEPFNIENNAPCLVYYHGGGFIMGLMEYHLNAIRNYVLKTPCKVVCVDYRLAPDYPFPVQIKDSYETLLWTEKNAKELNIDVNRIAVGGDSAGAALAATIALMARDKKGPHICFQMLNYPYLDYSMSTESYKKFTDTPVWNAEASKMAIPLYFANGIKDEEKIYSSVFESKSFSNLPNAYLEVAEFDCLRDEGLAYAHKLKEAGIEIEVVKTKGTVHAYDFIADCDTTKKYMNMRVEALKRGFNL